MSADLGWYEVLARLAECSEDRAKEAEILLWPQPDGRSLGMVVSDALADRCEQAQEEAAALKAKPKSPVEEARAALDESEAAEDEAAEKSAVAQTAEQNKAAAENMEPNTMFRCWPCGAGGTCQDVSKLGTCAGCGAVYETWKAGDGGRTGRQRVAEEFPAILARKPYKARASSKGCEVCGFQIKKGTLCRRAGGADSKQSSRRVCDDCVDKQTSMDPIVAEADALTEEIDAADTSLVMDPPVDRGDDEPEIEADYPGILDEVPVGDDSTDVDW